MVLSCCWNRGRLSRVASRELGRIWWRYARSSVPCRRSTQAFRSGRCGGLTTGWTPKASQQRRTGLRQSCIPLPPTHRGSRETADSLGEADPLQAGEQRAKDGLGRRRCTGFTQQPQGRADLHRIQDLYCMRLLGGDQRIDLDDIRAIQRHARPQAQAAPAERVGDAGGGQSGRQRTRSCRWCASSVAPARRPSPKFGAARTG
jgi:hypothetical protein